VSSSRSVNPAEAKRSIENLSLMRAYQAADPVAARFTDAAADVRREAAMCLGRIGGRRHLAGLLAAPDGRGLARMALLTRTPRQDGHLVH
jgi:hypothetical protein